MSLLVLDSVSKCFAHGGGREHLVLRGVSLEIASSEVVAVWGRRRSGRSTLLRVAGGIEPPSDGVVRFAGGDLRRRSMLGVPGGIGYCTTTFTPVVGESVLEHVAAPLLAGTGSVLQSQARALETLRRVDAAACAPVEPEDLGHSEAVRVGIARALVTEPRLLLVDEPTGGAQPARERDGLLALLRGLADREGISVLMTVDEATDLAGADRALTMDTGELRGERVGGAATVLPFRRANAR